MSAAVVSDTSPLNYLVLIDAVEILPRRFSEVIIPLAVASELSHPGTPLQVRRWLEQSPLWLKQKAPHKVNQIQSLDAGETEAICLAEELGINLLILDERKGRRVARDRGLLITGTLAILEQAAEQGWLDFDEHIRRLKATPFRIHERLIDEARRRLEAK